MMKRRFLPLCGGRAVAALGLCATLSGASDSDDPLLLPEIIVSASRLSGELATPTRDVVIVDAREIAARAPATITELLGSLPGIDIRTRGPWGVQADLEIDGSTFSQVLILVNGVRANDPQTGHHALNLPLDPADLERAEVPSFPDAAPP